eukprot:scaffold46513_cov60-Phaeocystis_antarctica.AAC.2
MPRMLPLTCLLAYLLTTYHYRGVAAAAVRGGRALYYPLVGWSSEREACTAGAAEVVGRSRVYLKLTGGAPPGPWRALRYHCACSGWGTSCWCIKDMRRKENKLQ